VMNSSKAEVVNCSHCHQLALAKALCKQVLIFVIQTESVYNYIAFYQPENIENLANIQRNFPNFFLHFFRGVPNSFFGTR
jgi:hypothetical protein